MELIENQPNLFLSEEPDAKDAECRKRNATTLIGAAVSVLLHLVVFGLLFTASLTALNPYQRQTLPVIQVTLTPPIASHKKSADPTFPIPSKTARHAVLPTQPGGKRPAEGENGQTQVATRLASAVTLPEKDPLAPAALTGEVSDLSAFPPGSGAIDDPAAPDKETSAPQISGASVIPGNISHTRMPRYLKTPYPAYPVASRQKGQEGLVLISVLVMENGRVGQVRVKRSSGHILLDQSALAAIRSWQFEPAGTNDIPEATMVDIPIRFSLKNDRQKKPGE